MEPQWAGIPTSLNRMEAQPSGETLESRVVPPRTRRIVRILSNAACALSLLICVAFLMLWVRSEWCRDVFIVRTGPGRGWWIGGTRGGAQFVRKLEVGANVTSGWDIMPASYPTDGGQTVLRFGVARTRIPVYGTAGEMGYMYDRLTVVVPYPLLVASTAVLPTVWLMRTVRRRRRASRDRGLCAVCGYDLRATRDRCPECGAVPAPSA